MNVLSEIEVKENNAIKHLGTQKLASGLAFMINTATTSGLWQVAKEKPQGKSFAVAVVNIPEGELIAGKYPNNKLKLVQVWIEIDKDELMADWKLALEGNVVFKIDPLK